ncbi:MAG TPA: PAS domain-containing protein, partial [Thermomicrobiales bacterium]|nr:PAS domain-containing protein [Thermomicrobiales bacterium]
MSDEARDRGRSAGTDDAASMPPASSAFALEAAGLGQWSWDAAADVVVWSPQEERLHGLAPGAFGGDYAAFLDLVHPDDRERVRQSVIASLADRADHHVEYRARWPDGTIRWIAGWGRVVRDAAGAATGMAG